VAFHVQLITDFNQVTYHFLSAMHAIALTKGGATTTAAASFGANSMVHSAPTGDNLMSMDTAATDNVSPIEQSILDLFQTERNSLDDTGYGA